MKKNKTMLYGAGEATTLDSSKAATVFEDLAKYDNGAIEKLLDTSAAIRFGRGAWSEGVLERIRTAADAKEPGDNKIRLVYNIDETGSGAVMAGNQLVSSKILDITVDGHDGYVVDAENPDYDETGNKLYKPADGAFKRAEQVTVKWFGFGHDNRVWDEAAGKWVPRTDAQFVDTWGIHTTQFEIVDPDAIQKLIEDMDARVKNLEEYVADTDKLVATEGTALTVKPTTSTKEVIGIDGQPMTETFAAWEVAVNVDDDTVQIRPKDEADADSEKVLKVATYNLFKVGSAELADYEGAPEVDDQYASQYQMVVTKPDGSKMAIGETINIFKDFLLKEAHVCTFDYYAPKADAKIDWANPTELMFADPAGKEIGHTPNFDTLVDNAPAGVRPWANIGGDNFEWAVDGKNIKWGHTYLHLVLNTVKDDENTIIPDASTVDPDKDNNLVTDVFLDFTDIFSTFSADEKYIHLDKPTGKFWLDTSAVAEMADELIEKNHIAAGYDTLSDHIKDLDASVAALETSVNAIEESYVKVSEIEAPSADNEQFNTVIITNAAREVDADGNVTVKETTTEFDVANEKFYQALNDALAALKENDTQLATLLTWESLD